ncbi:MAG: zinc-ribbon domain-containing protein [Lachnospiraceae bacterium]|nr:zinc-ribbon domain-containing protein [Lachnospiraceae bacterium]
MFCKKCGKEIENGMKFCKSCGTPVEKAEAATQNSVVVLGIRIGIVVASLLMIVSTVLPYVIFDDMVAKVAGMKSITLLKPGNQLGDGVIYIIIAVIAIVCVCIRQKIPVLIWSIISALMCWYEKSQMEKQLMELQSELKHLKLDAWDFMEKGSGWHLLTVSVVLLLILSVLYFILEKKVKK